MRFAGTLKRSTMLVFLLMSLVIPSSVFAKSHADLKISESRLDVWPEYDDGRVKVLYEGEFTSKKDLPAKVRFYIPKGAEDIHACDVTDDGSHQCNSFEQNEKDGLIELTYELTLEKFAVMFYYDPLKNQKKDKSFSYLHRTNYPIDKLTIDLQQPLKASDFKAQPPAENTSSDEQGFKYALYEYDGVAPGDEMKVGAEYTKTSPDPSIDRAAQTSGAPTSSSPGGGTNPWVVMGVVGLLVALPLGGYFLATSRTPAPAGRVSPKVGASRGKKDTKFCTNCGTKVSGSNKFCPSCGRKLK
ncbi:MAG: zinc ribbon domain-containing protein [Terriglobia bacterium]